MSKLFSYLAIQFNLASALKYDYCTYTVHIKNVHCHKCLCYPQFEFVKRERKDTKLNSVSHCNKDDE